MEEKNAFPDTAVGFITLADKYALEDGHSKFFLHNRSTANPANFEGDVGSQDEASIAPNIQPVEAPVEKHSGEPLPEIPVVPFTSDEETVLAAGMTMSSSCTMKVLRAGCGALGFSSRGGKHKCLRTMVERVKAQALLAAHGGEMRARHETKRETIAQILAR